MRWYNLPIAPPAAVPMKFYVALSFNPEQTKGIYLGLDNAVTASHSFIGLPAEGFAPVTEKYDWMIRAVLTKAKPETTAK
jgi:hypothetical protein